MRRKVTLPWDAASWRSRTYTPRVTKVHGPVGERVLSTETPLGPVNARNGKQPWFADENGNGQQLACAACGYHVCSCERQVPGFGISEATRKLWMDMTPREGGKLTRAQLYERAGYVTTPMPAEPTLCDAPVPPSPGPVGPHVCPGHCEYNCRSCREHCKAPLIASLHCHLPKQPCVSSYAPPAQKPEPIAYNFPLTLGLERGC